VFFVVLLAAFAAGIWGSYRAVFPAKGLYRVTGIFQSRAGDTLILVRHEAVPGLMEEMSSMAFFVESKDLLDRADLRPGDRVRFTIRQVPDRLLVVEIQKIR
jgi:Cu/Ag efflux protein CusF